MKRYIMISRGDWADWNAMAPADWEKQMQGFSRWIGSIEKVGKYYKGTSLDLKLRSVSQVGGKIDVVDGPFSEAKEGLTGFFVMDLPDLETATRIAAESPTLLFDRMEIFESQVPEAEMAKGF